MSYFVYLILWLAFLFFFFFQAEDGIRDATVTGVQTCALPICIRRAPGERAGPSAVRSVGDTVRAPHHPRRADIPVLTQPAQPVGGPLAHDDPLRPRARAQREVHHVLPRLHLLQVVARRRAAPLARRWLVARKVPGPAGHARAPRTGRAR